MYLRIDKVKLCCAAAYQIPASRASASACESTHCNSRAQIRGTLFTYRGRIAGLRIAVICSGETQKPTRRAAIFKRPASSYTQRAVLRTLKTNEMELARNVWRRSLFVYKTSVQASLRSSSSESTKETQTPVLRSSDLQSKIKDEKIHNALGATDELSSYIGLAREFANDSKEEHPYVDKLKRVQMILFDLHHSILRSTPGQIKPFEDRHTKDLEEWITEYSKQLPPPEDYIIPGGGKACASLHIARTICRRAERSMQPLVSNGILDRKAQTYLKRLSDFLLTTSRIAAKCDKRTENIYIPRVEASTEK